jgi:hypothetical protein
VISSEIAGPDPGETDDPLELERRGDEAMLAVAGFKSKKTGKAR